MNQPVRTLLASNSRLFLEGIRKILENEKSIKIIAEALNREEIEKLLISIKPKLLFLDNRALNLDIHDLRKELHRCLEKLPPKYTIVFIMNKDQQMTLREIAHKLERPEGTVEKQLRRVVRYLKENLNVQN